MSISLQYCSNRSALSAKSMKKNSEKKNQPITFLLGGGGGSISKWVQHYNNSLHHGQLMYTAMVTLTMGNSLPVSTALIYNVHYW